MARILRRNFSFICWDCLNYAVNTVGQAITTVYKRSIRRQACCTSQLQHYQYKVLISVTESIDISSPRHKSPVIFKMGFPYNTVLLVGATSGIGAALADRLVQEGSKVIAVGRRQERLDAFVRNHGDANASSINYDITDRNGLDGFVQQYVPART